MEGAPRSNEDEQPALVVEVELRAPEGATPAGFTIIDGMVCMTKEGLDAAARQQPKTDEPQHESDR